METTHTPGPWRVELPDAAHPHYLRVRGPSGNWTISCTESKSGAARGCSPRWHGWNGEIADASLIAAAPDLLAALKQTYALPFNPSHNGEQWDEGYERGWNDALNQVYEIARTAIAKATV